MWVENRSEMARIEDIFVYMVLRIDGRVELVLIV